jgi:molybdopterin-guanine dinucleotide biosynthesis protein A
VVTVPCDSPFLPADLVGIGCTRGSSRTMPARRGKDIRPAPSGGVRARAPLRAANLAAFLEGGGRKIDAWYAALKVVEVGFDDERAFRNINTTRTSLPQRPRRDAAAFALFIRLDHPTAPNP